MNVIDHFKDPKTHFSFELLPPLKGHNLENIYKTIDNLMEFDPLNINITYHQEEIIFKKLESGLHERKSIRKRPGTVAISAAIKYHYPDVHVVPHIICGGFSKDATEYALIDLHFLGIEDLLVLRGDPLKNQRNFIPETDGHANASELVKQVKNMNNGIYLDKKTENNAKTNFTIGVAGYPEKHMEAPNMETDLQYLKAKVDAGAEYIVTQMFFDNQNFFNFVDKCRKIGINVPIIPGLKPITTLKDLALLPKVFSIDIPDELVKKLEACKTNQDAFNAGVEWGISQSQELIEYGVPALHFFTIGISDNIKAIAKEIF